MQDFILRQYLNVQFLLDDNGQDLIEYVLVVALIALAATAGMQTVANNINAAFSSVGTKVNTYTS